LLASACSVVDGIVGSERPEPRFGSCSIEGAQLYDTGLPRDGVPALTDPVLVPADDASTEYVLDAHRVIGIEVGGQYIAIPHNILWWHEIVNFNTLQTPLAVTYCPLTGSSMVFDRTSVRGFEFGVSGLLFNNNLVMYERGPDENDISLWPQMIRGARCGPLNGEGLEMYPAIEMRWDGWRALHPDTRVIHGVTGYARDYRRYPYGGYEDIRNPETLYPHEEFDSRRLPKERVLGIPFAGGGGIAFPFLALDSVGARVVVHETADGEPIVVFWDSALEAAMAFRPAVAGQSLTFEVVGERYVDVNSGSEWSFEGLAMSGPMAGAQLTPVAEAYVSFWFAWATFTEGSLLWVP
jgi:hypothetical protein